MNKNIENKKETKEELKELTLDDFINKAVERNNNKKDEQKIEISGYGLVNFKAPTADQKLEYMNASANAVKIDREGSIIGTDLIILNESAKRFIYFTCPYLKNPELQEVLEIKDPLDVVTKVFGVENLIDIATKIQNAFGDGNKVKRTVKN